MSAEIPIPTNYAREDRPWPRRMPAFTFLALLTSSLIGLGTFAYQFKLQWTPLERFYFSAFLRTAHLAPVHNPALRPRGLYKVLVIVYPGQVRLALDNEVAPVSARAREGSAEPAFRLSESALNHSARLLQMEPRWLDDQWFHDWLSQWIYHGRSLWNLCRNPWYAGLLTFAFLLPFALRKDLRDARQRRLGQVLKGANVITRSQFHRHTRAAPYRGGLEDHRPTQPVGTAVP